MMIINCKLTIKNSIFVYEYGKLLVSLHTN